MCGKKLIPLTEIDWESLQDIQVNVLTLRASIERGVKNAIKPWKVAQELENPSRNALQKAYDIKIERLTDDIFLIVVNELYL